MESTEKTKNAVVIVAAGRGERAGQSGGPKQYRLIGGQSVLARTQTAFCRHPAVDVVIVVVHADDRPLYEANTIKSPKLLSPCIGGPTRQASVFRGLQALQDQNVQNVLIHDAARPFITPELIDRVIAGISNSAGALPVLPLTDTIKRGNEGMVKKTISRHGLFAAQTPQGFDFSAILAAHENAANHSPDQFTDDASIAEWANIRVDLVTGDNANTKLTTSEDFIMAEKLLDLSIPDVRTGNGYDVHAFEAGDSVRLCGVDIAHNAQLKGHSDADVGLHALTDALLGATGDGDIGSHFPPSDPKWRDANSEVFFRHAVDLVAAKNGTITHLDVTLICETPKIDLHREKMRAEIARMADLSIERISVKATTNEHLGFIGRGEGIAGIATATVVFSSGN